MLLNQKIKGLVLLLQLLLDFHLKIPFLIQVINFSKESLN